jgi:hypothetical protein
LAVKVTLATATNNLEHSFHHDHVGKLALIPKRTCHLLERGRHLPAADRRVRLAITQASGQLRIAFRPGRRKRSPSEKTERGQRQPRMCPTDLSRRELQRITGVGLTRIDRIDVMIARTLLS